MLSLQTIETPNHILHEDLTGIATTPEAIAAQQPGLYAEMMRLCRTHRGLGLAANQVGLRMNLFFVASSVKLLRCPGGHLILQPKWKPADRSSMYMAEGEGCLSLPAVDEPGSRRFYVNRWDAIDAEWINTSGHKVTRRLQGLAAQVFQHEHDHLRGVTLLESSLREITQ
jgi:peptide deformylase